MIFIDGRFRRVVRELVVVVLLALSASGCATHHPISKLPQLNSDFDVTKSELIKQFPDIEKYEKEWRGFYTNYPLEKNVVARLGEPKRIERDWLYPITMIGTALVLNASPLVWGIVFAIRPDTPKRYYFEKGSYCVETKVDKTFVNGYEPYLTSWKWRENAEQC